LPHVRKTAGAVSGRDGIVATPPQRERAAIVDIA
jgi:hypothetical protein